MDFPADARARAEQDSFLLGDGLLVAPVLDQGVTARSVYLPAHPHGWYDFHSGQWFAGGQEIMTDAPLGHIPLFAAGGSMIAVSDKLDAIDPRQDMVRRLRVFAHRQVAVSVAELYDDDGVTPDWERGAGRLLRVTLTTDAQNRSQLSATSAGLYRPPYGQVRIEAIGGQVATAPGAEPWLTLEAPASR
jgi:alpha-glucosidase